MSWQVPDLTQRVGKLDRGSPLPIRSRTTDGRSRRRRERRGRFDADYVPGPRGADTPHHLLRPQSHEEDPVGTATWQSPCLPSWPQYGGRHSRRVPEAESCRVALRDCRWSLWRTIASRWIDRVSCSWRGLCSERWRCLAHHGARTRPKTHCVESAQTVNMSALIRLA